MPGPVLARLVGVMPDGTLPPVIQPQAPEVVLAIGADGRVQLDVRNGDGTVRDITEDAIALWAEFAPGAEPLLFRRFAADLVTKGRAFVDLWRSDSDGTLPARYALSVGIVADGSVREPLMPIGVLVTTAAPLYADAEPSFLVPFAKRFAFAGDEFMDVALSADLPSDDYEVRIVPSLDADGGAVAPWSSKQTKSGFRLHAGAPFTGSMHVIIRASPRWGGLAPFSEALTVFGGALQQGIGPESLPDGYVLDLQAVPDVTDAGEVLLAFTSETPDSYAIDVGQDSYHGVVKRSVYAPTP